MMRYKEDDEMIGVEDKDNQVSKGKVELIKFERGDEPEQSHIFEYSVEHNNGKTSVVQALTIRSVGGLFKPTWTATLALDDFPPQESPQAAAEKMADWLERLAGSMRTGEYLQFPDSSFSDIRKLIK